MRTMPTSPDRSTGRARRRWAHSSACVVIALTLSLTACAKTIRNVPTRALAEQSTATVARDRHECEQAVTGTLRGPWFPGELEYAACMIARNYQTYVQVVDAPLEVRKASTRRKVSQARILTDLVTCQRAVETNMSAVEKIARPTAAVLGVFFWPASLGSFIASATFFAPRQREYAACMQPLGYVVTPWTPAPNEAITPTTLEEGRVP